jgi:hypothetical protein
MLWKCTGRRRLKRWNLIEMTRTETAIHRSHHEEYGYVFFVARRLGGFIHSDASPETCPLPNAFL